MIPRIIHYCWFGGRPVPSEISDYIKTWRKHLPQFTIKQWDETNFDIKRNLYTEQAYYAKKYAFVSDVARLFALVTEGGLYLDTDVLIKKPLPEEWFDRYKAFFGFEHDTYITTGVMASEAQHPFLKEFLDLYDNISFFHGLKIDITTNVHRFTTFMRNKGFALNNTFQQKDGVAIFPQIYLCGKDWKKGRYDNDKTYALHDFRGEWTRDFLRNALSKHFRMCKIISSWHLSKLSASLLTRHKHYDKENL